MAKRYFGFLFYNALAVFVVSNGIFETVKRTYSNPSEVLYQVSVFSLRPNPCTVTLTAVAAAHQIGATLPKPAAFFINFIVIKALMGLPSELIRSSSFLTHMVKILFV